MTHSVTNRNRAPELPGTGGVWFCVVLLGLAMLLSVMRGIGPDHDKDGVSDTYETVLGLHSIASAAAVEGEGR